MNSLIILKDDVCWIGRICLLVKRRLHLHNVKMDESSEEACGYYAAHYDVVFQKHFQRSEKEQLGDPQNRKCRFCGKIPPEVTFRKVAHAISEALGNRGLTSAYECDSCNQLFGNGIESDLGEWSKPVRTLARISGKNGVPTLKKGSQGGWRIEASGRQLDVKSYEHDPIYILDEENQRVTFTLSAALTPLSPSSRPS